MRRTREQMEVVIQQWQESNQSKKAFCLERKISFHTFHYWYRQLSAPASSAAPAGFTEVNLQRFAAAGVEVIFPSGTRITFQSAPSADWLRELVR